MENLKELPKTTRATATVLCTLIICGTICIGFIASCTVKSNEIYYKEYYKYRTESSNDFWNKDKTKGLK